MAKRITYPEFVSLFAKQNGKDKQAVDKFLSTLFEIIVDQLEVDKVVKVRHIGTFKLDWVAPRRITNVNTGEDSVVGGNYKISFTPAKELAESVNSAYSSLKSVDIDLNEVPSSNIESTPQKVELMPEQSQGDFTLKKEIIAELNDARDILSQIKDLEGRNVEEPDALTEQDEPLVPIEEVNMVEITPESLESITPIQEPIMTPNTTQKENEYDRLNRLSVIVAEKDKFVIVAEEQPSEENLVESSEVPQPIVQSELQAAPNRECEEETIAPTIVVAEAPVVSSVSEQPIVAVSAEQPQTDPEQTFVRGKENVLISGNLQTSNDMSTSTSPSSQNQSPESTPEKKNTVSRLSVILVLAIVIACFAYIYFAYFNKGYSKGSADRTNEVTITIPSPISRALNTVVTFFSNLFAESNELETKDMKITREEDAPIEAIEGAAALIEDSTEVASTHDNYGTSVQQDKVYYIDNVIATFGYSLVGLSRKYYGAKEFWCYIYLENQKAIGDPNNLKAGTRLRIPSKESYGIDANNPASVERARQKCSEILRSVK